MYLYATVSRWIKEIPDHLKTQQMCDEAFEEKPYSLAYVPDCFKTQEMCDDAVRRRPWLLKYVPDHFKTQEMFDAVVMEDPWLLRYIPDWFITQQQVKLRDDYCIDDRFIKWYDGYKKRKA